MGTIVLLASFLLAASANPIANIDSNSFEDASDTHPGAVSSTDDDSQFSSEDDENKHGNDAATSGNSPDSTDSTQPSTGGNATNPTEVMTTSSDTTVSTTPTKTETSTQQSNDTVPTPADADPSDCRNATQKNHTYLLCSYSCQQDEMLVAPDKSPCYLYPPAMMTNILINQMDNRTEHRTNETGVCFDGRCVRNSNETPAAPTEYSPDTSTQQSNETYTTPSDADPKDCRNATEENHIYVLCTYTCQLDEVFTAPNNSVCYLHPPEVMTDFLITEVDNHTEHGTNETGVCLDGRCVQRPTETPAAPAESSPGTTTTTAAETNGQTESPTREQTSVMSAEPNDVSEFLPVPSPSQETPKENVGSPENHGNGHFPDVEKTSSTGTGVPVALPEALPGIRN